jgi:hypothetical protein
MRCAMRYSVALLLLLAAVTVIGKPEVETLEASEVTEILGDAAAKDAPAQKAGEKEHQADTKDQSHSKIFPKPEGAEAGKADQTPFEKKHPHQNDEMGHKMAGPHYGPKGHKGPASRKAQLGEAITEARPILSKTKELEQKLEFKSEAYDDLLHSYRQLKSQTANLGEARETKAQKADGKEHQAHPKAKSKIYPDSPDTTKKAAEVDATAFEKKHPHQNDEMGHKMRGPHYGVKGHKGPASRRAAKRAKRVLGDTASTQETFRTAAEKMGPIEEARKKAAEKARQNSIKKDREERAKAKAAGDVPSWRHAPHPSHGRPADFNPHGNSANFETDGPMYSEGGKGRRLGGILGESQRSRTAQGMRKSHEVEERTGPHGRMHLSPKNTNTASQKGTGVDKAAPASHAAKGDSQKKAAPASHAAKGDSKKAAPASHHIPQRPTAHGRPVNPRDTPEEDNGLPGFPERITALLGEANGESNKAKAKSTAEAAFSAHVEKLRKRMKALKKWMKRGFPTPQESMEYQDLKKKLDPDNLMLEKSAMQAVGDFNY